LPKKLPLKLLLNFHHGKHAIRNGGAPDRDKQDLFPMNIGRTRDD
jgi:hypothetical protein